MPLFSDTPDEYLPESMLRLYPYGLATGYEPVMVFRGDDYGFGAAKKAFKDLAPEVQQKLLERMHGQRWSEGQNPIDNLKDVGKFVENTVQTAGKEVGKVTKPIQNAIGDVSHEIGQIPVVGGLVQGVFDMTYMAAMWPLEVTTALVVDGKRLDHAVLDTLRREVQSVKEVAPYAQMVVGLVPGIGPGVSAALSAGLALAEGQSIDEIIKAGLIGAIPGGPLVKAAASLTVNTLQQVAQGHPIDLATMAQSAGGATAQALGLPPAASNALVAGIATIGAVANGTPLDKALTDGAITALPIPQDVKNAMTEATGLALELSHGAKLDATLWTRLNSVVNRLPPGHALRETLQTGFSTVKKLGQEGSPEQVMAAALQSGVADSLVSMGATRLPEQVKKGIKTAVALGTGRMVQAQKGVQLTQRVPGKLIESGIQLAKAHPLFGAARRMAGAQGGTRGFDLAAGLTQHQAKVFDVATARNSLPRAADKLGFDLACATRIGAVTHPKPSTRSAEAHAGHAIAMGMQGYVPEKKEALMRAVERIPPAAAGATAAVKEVAALRGSKIQQLFQKLR